MILRTLVDPDVSQKLKNYLVSNIRDELFGFNDNLLAWKLLKEDYILQGLPMPAYQLFLENPNLQEGSRHLLMSPKCSGLYSKSQVDEALTRLREYEKKRSISRLVDDLYDGLQSGEMSAKNGMSRIENFIMDNRSVSEENEDIIEVGDTEDDDASSKSVLDRVLNREKANLSRTGFKKLDDKLGGGCGAGDLFVVAATTGGGKTVSVFNMLKHVYTVNHENAIVVSLEMKGLEVTERLMANLSNVPYSKLKNKTFDDKEAEIISRKWKAFCDIGKKHKCKFKLWSPSEDVSITNVLAPLKGLGYKWVFIDYINLLSDATGGKNQNEAQALSAIARYAKRWAQQNKCIVVMLAQLDEKTGQVRYARAIKEHANTLLTWHYGEEEREKGLCTWHLDKSRGSELGSFDMVMELQYMRIYDFDDHPGPNGPGGRALPEPDDDGVTRTPDEPGERKKQPKRSARTERLDEAEDDF